MSGTVRFALCLLVACASGTIPPDAQSRRDLEGMWSDPPNTPEDTFCEGWCSDAGLERLNALLDDPANDSRPYGQLRAEADAYQREQSLRAKLIDAAAKAFPLDPATDPSFVRCEPYGLARQVFSRHQLEFTHFPDRIEMRYGEWAATRVVYTDGRRLAQDPSPSRMGYSVGKYENDALVIESAGIAPSRALGFDNSPQLHILERYTRSADGTRLLLTATLTDPVTLRERLVLKKVWRWAPESEITPELECERPTEFRREAR